MHQIVWFIDFRLRYRMNPSWHPDHEQTLGSSIASLPYPAGSVVPLIYWTGMCQFFFCWTVVGEVYCILMLPRRFDCFLSSYSPRKHLWMSVFVSVAEQWQTSGRDTDQFERRKAALCVWPLKANSRREVSVSTGPPVWFCQLPSYRQPAAAAAAPNTASSCRRLGCWNVLWKK